MKKKGIAAVIELEQCQHGHFHVTDARLIEAPETIYEAPDAERTIRSGRGFVGRTQAYFDNWDQVFLRKPDPDNAN